MGLKRRLKILGIVGVVVGAVVGLVRRGGGGVRTLGGRARSRLSRESDGESDGESIVEITIKEPDGVETRTEIEKE